MRGVAWRGAVYNPAMNADADNARADIVSVETVEEFARWTQARDGRRLLYRGLADTGWLVESAVYRRVKSSGESLDSYEEFKKHIVQLLDNARMRGHHRHEGRELSDLELLAKLQHYGAATCLIDFTYNPLVALWFACRELPDQNGKVVALDAAGVGALAFVTMDTRVGASIKQQQQFALVGPDELGTSMQDFLDFAVMRTWEPLPRENRVIAQQSIFVFGKANIEDHYYEEVHVPLSAKAGIRSTLHKKFGMTEESLFGDFAGFALANAHDKPFAECSADDHYDRAVDLFREGLYEKALHACDKAIAADQNHVEAHHLRGECNFHLGNFEESVDDLSLAIKIDPKHVDSIVLRGFIYECDLDVPSKAMADYTKIIQLASNRESNVNHHRLAIMHYCRGLLKAKLGDNRGAIADKEEATRIAPHLWNNSVQ